MSLGMFKLFYYGVFVWGGVGMTFIGVVVIKEMIQTLKRKNGVQ